MNVFKVNEILGNGSAPWQEEPKKVAAATVYIAQKVVWKNVLGMSLTELYATALIYRVIQEEVGVSCKALLDILEIDGESRVRISEIHKELAGGKCESLEANIIKMAEVIVKSCSFATDKKEFYKVLTANDEFADEIFELIGIGAIKFWFEYEEMTRLGIEQDIMRL